MPIARRNLRNLNMNETHGTNQIGLFMGLVHASCWRAQAKHYLFVDGVETDPATVQIGQTLNTPNGPQRIVAVTTEVCTPLFNYL